MKRIKGWKKGLAFTFSLALVAAPLTANAQVFSGGKLLSASAAEEVSENDAILAYLDELCKSKYEDNEDYKDLLFSEKALSVFQSGEDDYVLTDALRGVTAKGNTNGEHFMENKEYKSDWLYYYYFDELIVNEIKYVVTEDEYNAFLETQPKEPLQDTYEVSSAKEFEKAVNAVNSTDDDVTRTIRLTADITDFSEILDGRGEKIYFRFNTKAVLDLNGSFFGNPTSDKPYLIFTSNTEEAELTITDSSVSGSGKMYVGNIQADEGRVYIDSGTFKADFIGVSYRFGGIMSITGGKFILDPSNSDYFSLYELDDSVSLGYETVKADTIGEEEIYEVRRADTDITTAEQIYEPILSAVKERLENGFSNYSDTDKPVSGAFTEPQDEVMQFSAMWYLPFGGFTSENTGYAITGTADIIKERLEHGLLDDVMLLSSTVVLHLIAEALAVALAEGLASSQEIAVGAASKALRGPHIGDICIRLFQFPGAHEEFICHVAAIAFFLGVVPHAGEVLKLLRGCSGHQLLAIVGVVDVVLLVGSDIDG